MNKNENLPLNAYFFRSGAIVLADNMVEAFASFRHMYGATPAILEDVRPFDEVRAEQAASLNH